MLLRRPANDRRQYESRRLQATRFAPGSGLLILATLVAAATAGLAMPTANAIYCDRMAPLGVLAALSATIIALSFRALSGTRHRVLLGIALLLGATSLFASASFLTRYHSPCSTVQQQLRQLRKGS